MRSSPLAEILLDSRALVDGEHAAISKPSVALRMLISIVAPSKYQSRSPINAT